MRKKPIERTEREGRNGEEVHGGDGFPMIVQKNEPTLGGPSVSRGAAHPARDGFLGYRETEHEQLAINPWGATERGSPRPSEKLTHGLR
jgi:hypothetical protein